MASMSSLYPAVHGRCEPRFEAVRREFERNFVERGELGAAVCVLVDGEPMVDLWGGLADAETAREWDANTPVVVFSSTKGMTALAAHVLADRGKLEFAAPVATYWPEFAAAGKDRITVGMLLSHQAGLAAWREPLPEGALYDWELATSRLAAQAPYWEPGTRTGYHGVTFGFLVGEVVRRVDGRSVGTFLRDEIAAPLGAEIWIGLPEKIEARVARTELYDYSDDDSEFTQFVLANPDSLPAQLQLNTGGWLGNQELLDTRASHAAEIPAANGIATARGLATMYAPLSLGGKFRGVRIVGPEAIAGMRYVRARTDRDASALVATAFSLGFLKSWDNRSLGEGMSTIIGEDAFGHAGLGGSIGFADPSCRLAFAYVMNRHGRGTGINSRAQSLVDAVYRTLGSPTDEPGFWVSPSP
jgi:CubicO group peptidase (beta-lactamase class C family)